VSDWISKVSIRRGEPTIHRSTARVIRGEVRMACGLTQRRHCVELSTGTYPKAKKCKLCYPGEGIETVILPEARSGVLTADGTQVPAVWVISFACLSCRGQCHAAVERPQQWEYACVHCGARYYGEGGVTASVAKDGTITIRGLPT
jgi:hypothetical protein